MPHVLFKVARGFVEKQFRPSLLRTQVMELLIQFDNLLEELQKETEEIIMKEKDPSHMGG